MSTISYKVKNENAEVIKPPIIRPAIAAIETMNSLGNTHHNPLVIPGLIIKTIPLPLFKDVNPAS
jgi:hypothetical protein